MASSSKLPRSLRLPKRKENRKTQIVVQRRKTTGRLIARVRGDPQMERYRMKKAVEGLFTAVGLGDPVQWIFRKTEEKKRAGLNEKCVVFEIGHGLGHALDHLAISTPLAGRSKEIEFVGMDALSSGKSALKNVRLMTGNILSKPFPRADLVFSQVVLGYAGNIGFLVRKAADALKPNGIAALHINKKGRAQFSDPAHGIVEGQMVVLIKDMPKLAANLEKMRIPDCTVEVFAPKGWGGNLAVLIRKK